MHRLGRKGEHRAPAGRLSGDRCAGSWMRSIGSSFGLRPALLAGFACAAVAGMAAETGFAPAYAATDGGAIPAQPASGPASFADIVDRVEAGGGVGQGEDFGFGCWRRFRRPSRFSSQQPLLSFLPSLRSAGRRRYRADAPFHARAGLRVLRLEGRLYRHQQPRGRSRERGHHHACERLHHAGQGDRGRQEDRPRAPEGAGGRFRVRDLRLEGPRGSATG